MRLWWNGALVVVAAVGLGAAACGGAEATGVDSSSSEVRGFPPEGGGPDANIEITLTDAPGEECGTEACFVVTSDKNISHIWFDFGECPVEDYRVLLATGQFPDFRDFTSRVKTKGGPCKSTLGDLDYRIEVPGSDRSGPKEVHIAEVCFQFLDRIPLLDDITIGAKGASECAREDDFGDAGGISAMWNNEPPPQPEECPVCEEEENDHCKPPKDGGYQTNWYDECDERD